MDLKSGGCYLHLTVENVLCRWEAKANGGENDTAATWSDVRSIQGQANLEKTLYAARGEATDEQPLRRVDVTIYRASEGQAARLLAVAGVKGFNATSFLNHFNARVATSEDHAESEALFLTLTLPDDVFDRAWRELGTGALQKTMQVHALLHCQIVEHWMETYFIQPGSFNFASPDGITILGQARALT